jgi:hypothetical protein
MTSLRIKHVPRRVYGQTEGGWGVAIIGTLEIHFDQRGSVRSGGGRYDDDETSSDYIHS